MANSYNLTIIVFFFDFQLIFTGLVLCIVSVSCGDDAKAATAAESTEKKAAVEPAAGDKKQDKRGIFGESYGYGGLGGYGDHSGLGYGDLHGHDLSGFDDHHHHHHHEKTVTVVKNVAVPYPVEKHIHVVRGYSIFAPFEYTSLTID